jgi:fatty acid desaturase
VDQRKYRRQTERRLLWAVIIILVVVGAALIGVFYGWPAIVTALLCLIPGALVILGLWLLLGWLERWLQDK